MHKCRLAEFLSSNVTDTNCLIFGQWTSRWFTVVCLPHMQCIFSDYFVCRALKGSLYIKLVICLEFMMDTILRKDWGLATFIVFTQYLFETEPVIKQSCETLYICNIHADVIEYGLRAFRVAHCPFSSLVYLLIWKYSMWEGTQQKMTVIPLTDNK